MKKKANLSLKLLLIILSSFIFISSSILLGSATPPTEEKVVYLTFDDGPTPKITEALLDILKEHQVKATFFVVGKEIKGRENILKRIYDEGHGIGLHTYSHNFKEIYRSPEAFIKEMDQVACTVNDVIGQNLDLKTIRFPGGSAGRLNQKFYDALECAGYKIFDWNVDLEDGVKATLSPDMLCRNAQKCMDKGQRKIILAHCNSNNINTCKALPLIIDYYQKQGYTFKAIDSNTTPYFYRFKK